MAEVKYLSEWMELAKSGNFEEAQQLYFEKLLPVIADGFSVKYSKLLQEDELLISILGFSPEPIILTAKAMKPKNHVIITTGLNQEVENIIESHLDGNFKLIRLKDEQFITMYKTLKEQLILNKHSKVVLDITGGKKSMVASASIFGKDYGCKIVYVDFDEYIKELRKPKPGSEKLNLVYDLRRDQPELNLGKK
jgi:hypothetical protein